MIEPPRLYTHARREYDILDIEMLGKVTLDLGLHVRSDIRLHFSKLIDCAGTKRFFSEFVLLRNLIGSRDAADPGNALIFAESQADYDTNFNTDAFTTDKVPISTITANQSNSQPSLPLSNHYLPLQTASNSSVLNAPSSTRYRPFTRHRSHDSIYSADHFVRSRHHSSTAFGISKLVRRPLHRFPLQSNSERVVNGFATTDGTTTTSSPPASCYTQGEMNMDEECVLDRFTSAFNVDLYNTAESSTATKFSCEPFSSYVPTIKPHSLSMNVIDAPRDHSKSFLSLDSADSVIAVECGDGMGSLSGEQSQSPPNTINSAFSQSDLHFSIERPNNLLSHSTRSLRRPRHSFSRSQFQNLHLNRPPHYTQMQSHHRSYLSDAQATLTVDAVADYLDQWVDLD